MRRAAVLLSVLLLPVWLAACGTGATIGEAEPQDLPLRYWSAQRGGREDAQWSGKLEEATGINVTFVHPPAGQEQEAFSLMLVSNQLPDLIEYDWYHFTGGPDRAITGKIILGLNELIEKQSPNLKAVLNKRPGYEAELRSAGGQFYMYPLIEAAEGETGFGFVVRGDILEEQGLAPPETVETWENTLKTLKNAGVKIPLCLCLEEKDAADIELFAGAFGVSSGFYLEGNKVKFGPYDPQWRTVVARLHTWREQGLLQLADRQQAGYWMEEGEAGAAAGTKLETQTWSSNLSQCQAGAYLTEVPPSTDGQGMTVSTQMKSGVQPYGTAISAQCTRLDLAASFLDYGYSAAGSLLYNNGPEGKSKAVAEQWGPGPYLQEKQAQASVWTPKKTWGALPLTYFTEKESKDYEKLMQQIEPWCRQALYDFVTGTRPLDTLDQYFSQLREMGIEKAVELRQIAYERYLDSSGGW